MGGNAKTWIAYIFIGTGLLSALFFLYLALYLLESTIASSKQAKLVCFEGFVYEVIETPGFIAKRPQTHGGKYLRCELK